MARILVVDDRAENRDLLAYLLRYHGHTVFLASDGAAAVRAAVPDPPDLVLLTRGPMAHDHQRNSP
jgi:CheY-like chemotaxis protein